ncbi:MAG: ABC transporter substrate-binding protein [Pseudorhodobacter sp.]|nr:ABC transporter substrate-binding protein [Pseudorhodobacter sp.]
MFRFLIAAIAAVSLGTPAAAQSDLRFAIDGPLSGASAAYVLAADSGMFAAEGLSVELRPTRSGLDVVGRVSMGTYVGGVVDFGTFAEYLVSNPDSRLIAAMIIHDRPGYVVIGRKSRGVAAPADLHGHTVGYDSDSLIENRLVNFANAVNLKTSEMSLRHVDPTRLAAALAAGEVDAVVGTGYEFLPELARLGVPPDDLAVFHMADHGVVLYGQVVVISVDTARQSSGTVSKLLTGILNGWKAAIADPEAAVAAVVARNPELDAALETDRLKAIIAENVLTPYVLENGFGDINQRRIEWTIAQLQENPIFIASEERGIFFTDLYLPPASARTMP